MSLFEIEPCKPELFYFKGDGITPNNSLPMLLYRQVKADFKGDMADGLEMLFVSHDWTNNWRDVIMSKNHYHSSSHEVLGICQGSVKLKMGGHQGRDFLVTAGDVIVIPAGLGHFSLETHTDYQVVGGYPEGREWNMIYDEQDRYESAIREINRLPLPNADPIFGSDGPLNKLWV